MIAGSWGAYSDVVMKVVNMPGATGVVGTRFVLESAPDGYTLINPSAGASLITPMLQDTVGYDPEDLMPVCLFNWTVHTLCVHPDSPIKTAQDYVAYAKENPGKLTVGTPGIGGATDSEMRVFTVKTGIEVKHVPFDGASDALAALVGGHIDSAYVSLASSDALWKAGEIVNLGVAADERMAGFDLPTFLEGGIDVSAMNYRAVFAPPGTPQERIEILSDTYKQVMADASNLNILKRMGENPTFIGAK
ncbi:Bug family tripartite tricarboxylate transporter substrate binding protein, partial [Chloroflexota bacterium]